MLHFFARRKGTKPTSATASQRTDRDQQSLSNAIPPYTPSQSIASPSYSRIPTSDRPMPASPARPAVPSSPTAPSRAATTRASAPTVLGEKKDDVYSFSRFALGATRRAAKVVKRKLSSLSPPSSLPRTWEEYRDRYAGNEIDIDDPPLPPARSALEALAGRPLPPTPFDERAWPAPHPPNESNRQAIVSHLDLLGTRHAQSPSTTSLSSSRTGPPSLENHPAFRSLVQRCRLKFETQFSFLAVLDDEQLLFLSTGGFPPGLDTLPRSVSYCAHTILNEERGLVVLDTHRDWRFAQGPLATDLGVRFYAGVPLLVPTFGNPSAPPIAIGTLCLADVEPHASFSNEKRQALRDLAAEASAEVEGWMNARMGDKLERLEELFQEATAADVDLADTTSSSSTREWTQSSGSLAPLSEGSETVSSPSRDSSITSSRRTSLRSTAPSSPEISFKPSGPPSPLRRSPSKTSRVAPAPSIGRRESSLPIPKPTAPPRAIQRPLALATITASPFPLVPAAIQVLLDRATSALATSLSLCLVYVISLPLGSPENTIPLNLISSSAATPDTFDSAIHFQALRAAEGGLLYRNPRKGPAGFASGLMVPVLEVRGFGYVLAGYTRELDREWGEEDMRCFVACAEKLEGPVARIGRGC